jgi:hypothetical protein
VFVGFPDPGDDPWVAVNEGYEVQIDPFGAPSGDPLAQTGAIYGFQAASAHPAVVGEWNTLEIEVDDPVIRVWVNGEQVNGFESTDPARDLSSGYVGLQNHGDTDRVLLRDVRVRDLEPVDPVEPISFTGAREAIADLAGEGLLSLSEERRLLPQVELAEHNHGVGRADQALAAYADLIAAQTRSPG